MATSTTSPAPSRTPGPSRPAAARALRMPRWLNVPGLLFIAVLAGIWELAVDSGALTYQYLPAPSAIVRAGIGLAASGELLGNIAHTLLSTLVGWVIASLIGLALGVWLGLARGPWKYSMATVEVLRAVPAISFVPVAVLLLGFSVRMELVIIVYVSGWPVLVNTIQGVRNVTPTHNDVTRIMHMSTLARIRKIVLPSAAPEVIVGLRLGLALALALAVVAEMVGNPAGIGYALVFQQQALQPEKMFAYVVVIGLLGLLLNSTFVWLTRTAFPGVTALLREEA